MCDVTHTTHGSDLSGSVRRANEMLGLGYPTGGTGWPAGSAPLTVTLTTDPLRNGQVLAEQDASGRQAYLYGLNAIGRFDAQMAYYLTDGSGTVRQTTNASGTVTLARTYASFGAVLHETGSDTGVLGYLGALRQNATGLLYGLGRVYDPATGRFLTRGAWQGNPW